VRLSATGRRGLGALFAVVAGVAIAWVDSRPGFDATAITVLALVIAAAVGVVIAGARGVGPALLIGVLVGAWIPLLELGGSPGAASLAALGFAVTGALGGVVAVRLLPGGGFTVR